MGVTRGRSMSGDGASNRGRSYGTDSRGVLRSSRGRCNGGRSSREMNIVGQVAREEV